MDFEFSSDQDSLRETIRRFLNDRAPLGPYVRAQLTDPRGTSAEVWGGLAELGATGILVPEAFGGTGMGMVDMGVVLEEMGRLVHPGPFVSSAVGAVSAVLAVGDHTDCAALLPGLADGTSIGALAILEERMRGAWRGPKVGATRSDAAWRLTGTKVPVPDAVAATVLLVSARTPAGVGLFAVDPAGPGVEVVPIEGVDGTRKAARVVLRECVARPVGDVEIDATEALAGVIDRVVIALVTDGVGASEAALDLAVAHAKERVQFDKPIGSFQAVQHLCADMLQSVELARAGAYYALWAADAATPDERHRAATMAKGFASDALFRVGASCIQVLAGIGFTWEHDAHLYYKRLLTLQQAYGGSAHHLEELASLVV